MELIVVVVISAGMAENSQNGVSRSLSIQCEYNLRTYFVVSADDH